MDKLKFFTFNNVSFKTRIFTNFEAHIKRLGPESVLPGWLELFEQDMFEDDRICEARLFRLIGFGEKTMMSGRHFVDDHGEAWPQETFIVLEDDRPNGRFALVVAVPKQ